MSQCHPSAFQRTRPAARSLVLALLAGALWAVSPIAHAATVYRCVDAGGHVAWQDAPCPAVARSSTVAMRPQPLIDPHAAAAATRLQAHDTAPTPPRRGGRRRVASHRTRQQADAAAWKCEADDGEVFYRLTHCPGSIRSDGTVRVQWGLTPAQPRARNRRRGREQGIHVHATRVARSEACRQINALTASGRDGYRRDQRVSVYDHLVGRDPCAGT